MSMKSYPHIESWIAGGSIEIGSSDEYDDVTARVTEEGATIWESDEDYPSLEATLDAIERAIAKWLGENEDEDEED